MSNHTTKVRFGRPSRPIGRDFRANLKSPIPGQTECFLQEFWIKDRAFRFLIRKCLDDRGHARVLWHSDAPSFTCYDDVVKNLLKPICMIPNHALFGLFEVCEAPVHGFGITVPEACRREGALDEGF